jgi:hypothetical protein
MHAIISLLLLLAAAPVQYGPETWFESDPKPTSVVAESIGNPLDYAAARIGLDARNVELPRGWEGAYRYCCRFPIIDYVSNRPLYMKQWAEDQSAKIVSVQRQTGLGVLGEAIGILTDGPVASVSRGAPTQFSPERRDFTPKYWAALSDLVSVLAFEAGPGIGAARAALGEDTAYFLENPGRYLAPDGNRMADITGNTDSQLEFIDRARRVQFGRIFRAASQVEEAVRQYVTTTAGWKASDYYADTGAMHDVVRFDTPLGPVVIAGFGNDRHTKDAALLIDLGGNDTYTNNAGGTGRGGGVALCIDHSGNDHYLAPDSSYVQGFGFLGIGMLVDLAGNDVYKAKHFSQGAGILGVGVLWDKAGSDTFSAHTFCQGAGMFGLGMMLDDAGDDVYDCASNGQGSATTLGLGILSDLEGNDKYRLACDTTKDAMGGIPGYGQGGALSFRAYPWEKKLVAYGGVGMLVDDKGNDDYVSKGWNCQGGSYIMSLGVLVDNEGNDHYDCGTGQGSGIHVTNAILIDKKGDDVYEGGFRAGGSGSDRSPGFLIDYEGNDTYKSATSSYGTACKPFAYSLFIDYKGDDKYICEKPKGPVLMNDWHSFGGVWPESDPNAWPYAISLDLGGNDTYHVRNRANNSETHSFGHGIHLDMEWKGGDLIGRVQRPYAQDRMEVHIPATDTNPIPGAMEGIRREPSPFSRFQTVGSIVDAGGEAVQHLCRWLGAQGVERRQVNRDLLECLHYWFVQGKIGDKELPEVLKLLTARDPEVRLIIADDLGLWKMRGAEDALVEAVQTDSNAQVRRFALRSLIRLESAKVLPIARKLATEDTCEDVRRMAVTLVARVKPDTANLSLFRWALAEDRASSVRCAAADALGNLGDPRAIESLRAAAGRDMTEIVRGGQSPALAAPQSGTVPTISDRVPSTNDVYVQRACARALCALYQVEGIQLLINSMSFPSIDAFYNYDRNVPNYISSFAGFDLPDSERFVQAKWQAWFDTHRDSIDIKGNADAFKAYNLMLDSIRDNTESVQVARYEAFLVRFPKHSRARAELAGKLNSLAWGMVTAPKGAQAYQPKQGLEYARRAVELAPDPNNYDTLIEACLANGLTQQAVQACVESLERYPGNAMLEERWRKLKGSRR